mgnify:CR=1 FL=1
MKTPEQPKFIVEPLNPVKHRREAFDCGVETLTMFLRKRANQEARAFASACFVFVPKNDSGRIAGFYTLSQTSVVLSDLPIALQRKLPRYPTLGATLIGRLARDLAFKGCGLGDLLLLDALRRALRHAGDIPAVVVVVDPKDLAAVAFYKRNGFQPLDDRRMFISMAELKQWEAQGWKS